MTLRTRRAAVVSIGAALTGGLATPVFAQPKQRQRGPAPLRRAHAHNDFVHPRPLLDALSHGFASVEADIWL
ncbi:hypothetical protein QMK28_34095, partial [Streptomyces sp. H27-D2]|nr:hypothetical protein [Streptomyces sp. H27-D2]